MPSVGCWMPRAIALAIATTLLAACATARSDRPASVVCPPVPVYSEPFLKRAAELDRPPSGSAIEQMLSDYQVMRDLPGKGDFWAIEIKRGLSSVPGRGLTNACRDLKPKRAFVLYAGEERHPISQGVEPIGLKEMAELLQKG